MQIHRLSTIYIALAVAALHAPTARADDDPTTDTVPTNTDESSPPPKGFIPPFPPVLGVDKADWEAIKKAHPNNVMTTNEWADFFLAHPMPPRGMDAKAIVAKWFHGDTSTNANDHTTANPSFDMRAMPVRTSTHHTAPHRLPQFPPCGVSDTDWQQVRADHPNGWSSLELAEFLVDHPFPHASMTKGALVTYLDANPCPHPKMLQWMLERHHRANATRSDQ